MSVDILGTSWDQCRSMVQYSFTSTESRKGSLGRTAQEGHLDSHTAPELWEILHSRANPLYKVALSPLGSSQGSAWRPGLSRRQRDPPCFLPTPPISHTGSRSNYHLSARGNNLSSQWPPFVLRGRSAHSVPRCWISGNYKENSPWKCDLYFFRVCVCFSWMREMIDGA